MNLVLALRQCCETSLQTCTWSSKRHLFTLVTSAGLAMLSPDLSASLDLTQI
jgi:hypothetical protein